MEDKIGVMYLGAKENARGHWQSPEASTEAYNGDLLLDFALGASRTVKEYNFFTYVK